MTRRVFLLLLLSLFVKVELAGSFCAIESIRISELFSADLSYRSLFQEFAQKTIEIECLIIARRLTRSLALSYRLDPQKYIGNKESLPPNDLLGGQTLFRNSTVIENDIL